MLPRLFNAAAGKGIKTRVALIQWLLEEANDLDSSIEAYGQTYQYVTYASGHDEYDGEYKYPRELCLLFFEIVFRLQGAQYPGVCEMRRVALQTEILKGFVDVGEFGQREPYSRRERAVIQVDVQIDHL
ncbi:hypothetical protein U1Q18_052154 [Sarracenia purpurea var. burkii]